MPDRGRTLPPFKLTGDRVTWRKDEAWFQIRPLDYREHIAPLGWETLNMWFTPTRDSLVLFRPIQEAWTLYVGGTWHADTLRGRAYYWRGAGDAVEAQANAYAVGYDCSAILSMGASAALAKLLTRDERRPNETIRDEVPERVRRLRFP
jgi:hypothetical protein